MNGRFFAPLGALLLVMTSFGVAAQNGYELFQQALRKERSEGDCRQAIAMYEKVSQQAAQNRELAANALVRAGECHEKLGQDAARISYERVIRDFADQKEQVGVALSRLAALTPAVRESTRELLVRQVWAEDGISDTAGAPSPDGRYVSYAHWKSANLAVRDLKAGTSRKLTDDGTWATPDRFAYHSVWSPDGQYIAYAWVKVRVTESGSVVNEPELRLVPSAGGKPKTVFQDQTIRWLQPRVVTPDGRSVVCTIRRADRSVDLVTISLHDGSLRVIRSLAGQNPLTVSISPDSRWILFDRPEGRGAVERDVMMIGYDGKGEATVIKHPANDYGGVWTPQGDGFVFASDRGGAVGLWFQKVADGRTDGSPTLVKPDMGRMLPLGFARNGTLFYGYASFENAGDVFSASFDFESGEVVKAGERMLHRFVGSNTSAAFSADGKRLAYLSRRGNVPLGPGSWAVVIHNLESGEEQILRVPDLEQINNPRRAPLRWSPDGGELIISGRDLNGAAGLYRVNIEDGSARPIGHGSWPQWAPDGKSVFLTSFNRLVRRDLRSGESAVLIEDSLQQGSITFALSPDGSQIAYRWIRGPWSGISSADKDLESGIRLLSLESGESRELVRFLREDAECPNTMVDWRTGMSFTADGRHVIFGRGAMDSDTDGIELWQAEIESGAARRLLPATKMIRDLAVHPDGKLLSYTVNPSFQAEVWVMENLNAVLTASK